MRNLINVFIILCVVFSIAIESYLTIFNADEIVGLYGGTSVFFRITNYYSYFTVLSNITVAVGSFFLLINPQYDSKVFRIVRLDGLLCIIITCVVYNIILRPLFTPGGIRAITNELLHLVVPLLCVIGWLLYGPWPRIDKKTMIRAIFPPLLYVIYIFIRGEIINVYPYPFMDAGKIGLNAALINVGIIIIIFILVEILLHWVENKLDKKSSNIKK